MMWASLSQDFFKKGEKLLIKCISRELVSLSLRPVLSLSAHLGIPCPSRQDYVVHPLLLPSLELPQVESVAVLKELGKVEEFRDELLDVVQVRHEALPRLRDGVELAVRNVESER